MVHFRGLFSDGMWSTSCTSNCPNFSPVLTICRAISRDIFPPVFVFITFHFSCHHSPIQTHLKFSLTAHVRANTFFFADSPTVATFSTGTIFFSPWHSIQLNPTQHLPYRIRAYIKAKFCLCGCPCGLKTSCMPHGSVAVKVWLPAILLILFPPTKH